MELMILAGEVIAIWRSKWSNDLAAGAWEM